MDDADKFLKQCVNDGRITQDEFDEVRLGRESSGCIRPEWRRWVRPITMELQRQGLTVRDCEAYINYPAWTLAGVAEKLGVTVDTVRGAHKRVRRLLRPLQKDPSGDQGLPNLSHMIPLDDPNVRDPGIDGALQF